MQTNANLLDDPASAEEAVIGLLMQAGRKPDEEANVWVTRFTDRVMAKCITKEEWLHSMHLTHDDPAYVPLTNIMVGEEAEAIRQAALEQAKSEMERDVLKAAGKQFQEGLFKFEAEVRGEVSALVLEVVTDCLAGLRKNKKVLPRNSSKQLKNLIERVEGLVFWDEPTLTAQMSEIKVLLDKPSRARDGVAFEKVMQDVETEARFILTRLNRPIEGKAQRHVSDQVDDSVTVKTRQARKTVAVDEVVSPGRRQSRKTGMVE